MYGHVSPHSGMAGTITLSEESMKNSSYKGFSGKARIWEGHPLYLKLWRENHRSAPKTLLEISEGTVRKRIFLTN